MAVVGAPLLGSACNTVGPRALHSGRNAYNAVLARTWDEQLLLNLVRLRYRDTPSFLEVASISTSYTFEGSAAVAGTLGAGDDSADSSLGVGFAERPTITYLPLSGEKFVKELLSPIPLEIIFLLPQSGWSFERVLRCCVQRMNDLPNAPSAAGPTPEQSPRYEGFLRAARLLRELQVRGDITLGVPLRGEAEKEPDPYVLRFHDHARDSEEGKELLALLSLENIRDGDVPMVPGGLDRHESELAIYPRSLMGVLFYLSQSVESPPGHEERGWVTVTKNGDGRPFDWKALTDGLLRIRSSEGKPDNAFVAIPYRGFWFYIDDSDLTSKSTFGLLTQIYSLKSGSSSKGAPLLTLPVG